MAQLIRLRTFSDVRGSLSVAEGERDIPFLPRRIFYIYNVGTGIERGGHRHRRNRQALICVKGSCKIFVDDGRTRQVFALDRPDLCLLLEPEDWHTMSGFTPESVLLVLASEHYDVDDYIDEGYGSGDD